MNYRQATESDIGESVAISDVSIAHAIGPGRVERELVGIHPSGLFSVQSSGCVTHWRFAVIIENETEQIPLGAIAKS